MPDEPVFERAPVARFDFTGDDDGKVVAILTGQEIDVIFDPG
jgi:hypothetical protein